MKIDSRWIGLQGPTSRIWWIQNELTATAAISATQIQPMVRWGNVPLGAANWTMPSTKAAIAAKACIGICGSGIEQRRKAHRRRSLRSIGDRK